MIFKPKPDRRRRKRQLLNTSVRVFTDSAQLDAVGINVTDVGMCLFTMANLPVGSRIQVEFVPPESFYDVRLSGIVRHRAVYLYGIEFVDHCANVTSRVEGLDRTPRKRPIRKLLKSSSQTCILLSSVFVLQVGTGTRSDRLRPAGIDTQTAPRTLFG